jgi:hypothetical protein
MGEGGPARDAGLGWQAKRRSLETRGKYGLELTQRDIPSPLAEIAQEHALDQIHFD